MARARCACPRCDSEDTRFSQYNNNNIEQSQYFCKGCKRHSTAGGTLRAPSRKKARAKSGGSAAGSNPAEVAVADVVPS